MPGRSLWAEASVNQMRPALDEQFAMPLPALSHQRYWGWRHKAITAVHPAEAGITLCWEARSPRLDRFPVSAAMAKLFRT